MFLLNNSLNKIVWLEKKRKQLFIQENMIRKLFITFVLVFFPLFLFLYSVLDRLVKVGCVFFSTVTLMYMQDENRTNYSSKMLCALEIKSMADLRKHVELLKTQKTFYLHYHNAYGYQTWQSTSLTMMGSHT